MFRSSFLQDFSQKVLTNATTATNRAISVSSGHASDSGGYRSGPQVAGIDLVAMLVSDSGLASTEPVWWNASPIGCVLIGLQPRGGWQVMQRTVQWGHDRVTKAFGVLCTKPVLYAYFVCSIRNRLEVWESKRWKSPMHAKESSNSGWAKTDRFALSRPTKLLDGSRGGQAFIAEVLRPRDMEHYGIEQQAHMQFLSILLVTAGILDDQSPGSIRQAFEHDLGLTSGLSMIYKRLFRLLLVLNVLVIACVVTVGVHLWNTSIFGVVEAYMVEVTSLICWTVGAIGLLMQGGNPRVRLVQRSVPEHIRERLRDLQIEASGDEKTAAGSAQDTASISKQKQESPQVASDETSIQIRFGSQHGSVFLQDKGYCYLSLATLEVICASDIELFRPSRWYTSVLWCGSLLCLSIVLQIVGVQLACIGSEVIGVIFLLATSVLRGSGISGPEEWQIPAWQRRKDTAYGAALQGNLKAR